MLFVLLLLVLVNADDSLNKNTNSFMNSEPATDCKSSHLPTKVNTKPVASIKLNNSTESTEEKAKSDISDKLTNSNESVKGKTESDDELELKEEEEEENDDDDDIFHLRRHRRRHGRKQHRRHRRRHGRKQHRRHRRRHGRKQHRRHGRKQHRRYGRKHYRKHGRKHYKKHYKKHGRKHHKKVIKQHKNGCKRLHLLEKYKLQQYKKRVSRTNALKKQLRKRIRTTYHEINHLTSHKPFVMKSKKMEIEQQ
ncbi:hypothetical protein QTN25_003827 [Entamoeba marina]